MDISKKEICFLIGILISFGCATLGAIAGVVFAYTEKYGCYESSTLNLCNNWKETQVTYVEYQNIDSYNYENNCNCNKCINSEHCDCDKVKCHLIGKYENTTNENNKLCIVVDNYKFKDGNDNYNLATDVIYESEMSYSFLNSSYKLNYEEFYYFNNKLFTNLCVKTSEVDNVGNVIFKYFLIYVVAFVMCIVIGTSTCVFAFSTRFL